MALRLLETKARCSLNLGCVGKSENNGTSAQGLSVPVAVVQQFVELFLALSWLRTHVQ